MTAAELAGRLHAQLAGSGRWRCRCPVHKGRSATSLSLREGDDGRVLIHCFGGCRTADVLAAAGLRWHDISPAGPHQPRFADALDNSARHAVACAQESLRRHPGPGTLRDGELSVVATRAEHVDHAIARALALAINGEVVQVVLDDEVCNAA